MDIKMLTNGGVGSGAVRERVDFFFTYYYIISFM